MVRHSDFAISIKSDEEPASLTRVGHAADSPESLLRPSPATGHAAEILDVYDPYLGYDAAKFPYQPSPWKMRSTSHAGLLGRFCANMATADSVG
jgi:hypothetical protein